MTNATTEEQIAAWDCFVDAKRLADNTYRLEDGIAAAKAWRQWLNLFMTIEQRNFLDAPGRE